MKQTVNEYQFRDAFMAIRPDNFSYAGLGALYEWLEQYEEGTGEEIELDVIALCCDFSEYTLEELQVDYGHLVESFECTDCEQNVPAFSDTCPHCGEGVYNEDAPQTINDWVELLNDHTIVIHVDDNTLIIQGF